MDSQPADHLCLSEAALVAAGRATSKEAYQEHLADAVHHAVLASRAQQRSQQFNIVPISFLGAGARGRAGACGVSLPD